MVLAQEEKVTATNKPNNLHKNRLVGSHRINPSSHKNINIVGRFSVMWLLFGRPTWEKKVILNSSWWHMP